MSEPRPDARAAIDALQGHEAWALIRRSTRVGGKDTVGLVGGRRWVAESIMDVPLESGPPAPGRTCDRLVAVPFRQVAERGFEAHDDGTPLVVVDVEEEREYSVAEVLDAIPDGVVELADRGGFDIDDDDYAKVVEQIITDEIGQGEGANLVVGRRYRAVVADWSAEKALTVFRRLLEREHGAYWTFLFFTGDRYLVGASPERHVSVHGGEVRMNPISGTFRLPKHVAAPDGAPAPDLKRDLLSFLADEKEIYELFMVVDEELKMMCDICHEGGQVLGPFLKPMSHLVHTEYLLAGRTRSDVREVLRDRPHLGRLLWSSTLLDAAMHRQWIMKLEQLTTPRRIAHIFAELWRRLEMVGLADEDGFQTPLTQVDLAEMCGATPVHANRALRELRERELASFRKGRVSSPDRAGLEQYADFAPDYLYGEGELAVKSELFAL